MLSMYLLSLTIINKRKFNPTSGWPQKREVKFQNFLEKFCNFQELKKFRFVTLHHQNCRFTTIYHTSYAYSKLRAKMDPWILCSHGHGKNRPLTAWQIMEINGNWQQLIHVIENNDLPYKWIHQKWTLLPKNGSIVEIIDNGLCNFYGSGPIEHWKNTKWWISPKRGKIGRHECQFCILLSFPSILCGISHGLKIF